jgi:aminoglycoside 3-N-acetyltransferase
MPEADTIHPDMPPLTAESLAEQFAACGLSAGQTVLVHTKMSALGWIIGGPVPVIQALLRVLGPTGTLMMPSHSTDNTDPAHWRNPPVPESWWPFVREHMPAYDPAYTPTRNMGVVANTFLNWPGVTRSSHPTDSFAALGPNTDILLRPHPIESNLGEQSPLARLYDLDGYVMLIGVDHGTNTSLHLAEHRANYPGKHTITFGCAVMVDGQRQWATFDGIALDDDDFPQLGDAYEAAHNIRRGRVGQAEVRFMKQKPLVDFAVEWMNQHRA